MVITVHVSHGHAWWFMFSMVMVAYVVLNKHVGCSFFFVFMLVHGFIMCHDKNMRMVVHAHVL